MILNSYLMAMKGMTILNLSCLEKNAIHLVFGLGWIVPVSGPSLKNLEAATNFQVQPGKFKAFISNCRLII